MPLTVARALASATVRGEDRIAVFELDAVSILVVADGAGGVSGGAVAAEMLIDLVRATLAAPGWAPFRAEFWIELLERADLVLEQDTHAGETTAVVVAAAEHGVVGASAGDSGAWMIHPDRVDDLTSGQHRKLRLGSGRARPVTFARPKLNGTLLLATDGLLRYASPERIAGVARQADLDHAARDLIQLVRLPSGGLQDDVAVALARPKGTS